MNKKVYGHIETWRNRTLPGQYLYVYLDGIYLKRSWGGEYTNVSVLVAIGVDQDGFL
jgi:putative transposase